jgi:hypothetical protein
MCANFCPLKAFKMTVREIPKLPEDAEAKAEAETASA